MSEEMHSTVDQIPPVQSDEAQLRSTLAKSDLVGTRMEQSRVDFAQLRLKPENIKDERRELDTHCLLLSIIVSEAQCRAFSREFHESLPLELREEVYKHACTQRALRRAFRDNPAYDASEASCNKDTPWHMQCDSDDCACFSWWELPLWLQSRFVGAEVAKEAAIACYRSGLRIRFLKQLQHFDRMLSNDYFHLGVKPVDHLRHLDIDLCQIYPRDSLECHQKTRWRERWKSTLEFRKQISALRKLQLKQGFQLSIRTTWHNLNPDSIWYLQDLELILRDLKEAGVTILLTAWHPFFQKNYDVSDFLTLSREDWSMKWRATLKSHVRERKRTLRRKYGDLSYIDQFPHHDRLNVLADSGDEENDDFLIRMAKNESGLKAGMNNWSPELTADHDESGSCHGNELEDSTSNSECEDFGVEADSDDSSVDGDSVE